MASLARKLGILLALPLIAGCSGGETSATTDQPTVAASTSTFSWSEDALFQVAIPKSEFEAWGFPNGPGSQSGTGEISTDSLGLLHDETSSTNPSECLAIYSFYSELKNHLPGNYYLFQEHYDATIENFTKVLVVGFATQTEAQATFDQIKSLAGTCGTFEAKRGSEVKSISLWDSLTIDEPTYIQGEASGIPAAFGINGSAVWYQEVITNPGEEAKARDAIAKSRAYLVNKLQSVQGN